MKLCLKNITAIQPQRKLNKKTNILITNGIITKTGTLQPEELGDATVLEMNGKYCAPGFLDMHVHLREPGREDKETIATGCNSAAAGGFTAVACMPNTEPAADSAEVIEFIKNKAKGHLVSVYPVAAASVGRRGEVITPMAELADAGAVAFSDDGVAIKSARLLRKVMEYSAMYNLPVIEHCEDESLAGGAMHEGYYSTMYGLPPLPSVAEDLIVARDILMAEYTGAAVHIAHISSAKSVALVREAKQRGVRVTAEVTPHHFTLTDELLKNYDTNYKMNPPLRSNTDVAAILEGLKDGTIDCIATDHAPHTIEEKEMEFEYAPNGILGLETCLGLAFSELYHKGVLTLEQIVEKLSVQPRKILNLPIPQIEVGEAANLSIFDPKEVWPVDVASFKSKSRNSPFDKRLCTGRQAGVINNGQLYYNGKFTAI